MRNGLAAKPLSSKLRYADVINHACTAPAGGFSPLVAYAIAENETIIGEINGKWDAATVVSGDGGHGLFQLTSSWPNPGWDNPYTNALWAVEHYLVPAETYWAGQGMQGDDLVRCIAATFNAGLGGAVAGHRNGDVDLYTTGRYAARALAQYHALLDQAA